MPVAGQFSWFSCLPWGPPRSAVRPRRALAWPGGESGGCRWPVGCGAAG